MNHPVHSSNPSDHRRGSGIVLSGRYAAALNGKRRGAEVYVDQ